MLKKVISTPGKKAMLVLPYVALVQEKLRWLRKVVEGIIKISNSSSLPKQRPSVWRKRGDEDSVRVVGFFGGSKSKLSWEDVDIAVCTIEKVRWRDNTNVVTNHEQANSLVNAAIDDLSIAKLGVVVMDELHMIDDENRGYILELMATKLLSFEQEVQIIGESTGGGSLASTSPLA